MITDLAAAGRSITRDCDLLILGAGPAGITTALELARKAPGLDIVLAEAGGFEPSTPAELDLYDGPSTGSSPYAISTARLRGFGGSSGHWGGWCRPFDEVDFLPRAAAGVPGWPIERDTLNPHYVAAHGWLEIPSHDYDPGNLSAALKRRLIDLDASPWFRNRLFRFSPPTRFATRYRADIEATANIDCRLNAAAIAWGVSGDAIETVTLGGLHDYTLTVRPRRVVIAMGGIESTRHLLLLRQQGFGAAGLHGGFLGRGFADHFGYRPGIVHLPAERIYQRIDDDSGDVMPVISPTPEALERTGWNNSCIMLDVIADGPELPRSYASNQLFGLSSSESWSYRVTMILEPRVNEDSRLELADERDALGLPRTHIAWEIDPRAYDSAAATFERFAQELGRLGLGRARIDPRYHEIWRKRVTPVYHHMGTLRMAKDAGHGVVDTDLKLFGGANLYVASSAVFPSFGYSNPTLTIVALAHRLAAHLRDLA